jgi:uncharacterized protein DUF2490
MKKSFSIIVFLFITFLALGQYSDFESWYGISVSTKIFKKTNLFAGEEIRFFDNSTRISEHHNEIGIDYRLSKSIKLDIAYKYILENSLEGYFANQHRFALDGRYRYKKDRWLFTYRGRIQMLFSEYYSSEDGKIPSYIIRNKFEVKYNIKNFKGFPSIGYEHYFFVNSLIPEDKFSIYTSFQYRLSKKMDAEISYIFRKQIRSDIPINRYILSFELSYDI